MPDYEGQRRERNRDWKPNSTGEITHPDVPISHGFRMLIVQSNEQPASTERPRIPVLLK
jgi:hypothetical protein